jgi:hypothetical protein
MTECSVCFETTNNKTNCGHDLCKKCKTKCQKCPICRNLDFKSRIPNYHTEGPCRNYFIKNKLKNKFLLAPDAYICRFTLKKKIVFKRQTTLEYVLKKTMKRLHHKVKSSYKGFVDMFDTEDVFFFNEMAFIDELFVYTDPNILISFDKSSIFIRADNFNLKYYSDNPSEIRYIQTKFTELIF